MVIHQGDALTVLRGMPAESVQCCVTSPPYWGLRDYGHAGQLGLEKTPEEYVARMVEVFREVRRVLKPDGVLWLNLGSSYAGSWGAQSREGGSGSDGASANQIKAARKTKRTGSIKRLNGSDAPACGSVGKEPEDYPGDGSSSSCLCGGCRAALEARTVRTDSRPALGSGACADAPTQERTRSCSPSHETEDSILQSRMQQSYLATPGSEPSPSPEPLRRPSGQESTTPRSSRRHPVECSHCANCGSCLLVLGSSSRDASLCGRRSEHTGDTLSRARSLVRRISDTEPWDLAYLYSTIASLRLKAKDQIDIPGMVSEALRLDGWYRRQAIVWAKKNPMPESCTDRCTSSHEMIFLLSKSATYYYNADAIKEPGVYAGPNGSQKSPHAQGFARRTPEQEAARQDKQRGHGRRHAGFNDRWDAMERAEQTGVMRNKRSVWNIATRPFGEAHFAVFPEEIPRLCILAGSKSGDTVLDPFSGAGTVGVVCEKLQRQFIGIELNADYVAMAQRRIAGVAPLFAEAAT